MKFEVQKIFSKGGVHEKSLVTLKTHRFRSFRQYFLKIGLVKSRFVKNIFFCFVIVRFVILSQLFLSFRHDFHDDLRSLVQSISFKMQVMHAS